MSSWGVFLLVVFALAALLLAWFAFPSREPRHEHEDEPFTENGKPDEWRWPSVEERAAEYRDRDPR